MGRGNLRGSAFQGVMIPPEAIATVAAAVIGSGAAQTAVSWALRRADGKEHERIEQAIEASPTIREIQLELDRQTLFAEPRSRAEHEHQLDVGEAYLKLGGNGAGHVRLDQLKEDYERRLKDDDWDY